MFDLEIRRSIKMKELTREWQRRVSPVFDKMSEQNARWVLDTRQRRIVLLMDMFSVDEIAKQLSEIGDEEIGLEEPITVVKRLGAEALAILLDHFLVVLEDHEAANEELLAPLFSSITKKADRIKQYIREENCDFELEPFLSGQVGKLISVFADLIIDNHLDDPPLDDPEYWSIKVAASRTGMSQSRLNQLISSKELTDIEYSQNKRRTFICRAELEKYLSTKGNLGLGMDAPEHININNSTYYSVRTVSAIANVALSFQRISQLVRDGQVEGIKANEFGGKIYVSVKSLKEYAATHKRGRPREQAKVEHLIREEV